jgi:hypothetical protein
MAWRATPTWACEFVAWGAGGASRALKPREHFVTILAGVLAGSERRTPAGRGTCLHPPPLLRCRPSWLCRLSRSAATPKLVSIGVPVRRGFSPVPHGTNLLLTSRCCSSDPCMLTDEPPCLPLPPPVPQPNITANLPSSAFVPTANDTVSVAWSFTVNAGPSVACTNQAGASVVPPTVVLPAGTHTITCVATDGWQPLTARANATIVVGGYRSGAQGGHRTGGLAPYCRLRLRTRRSPPQIAHAFAQRIAPPSKAKPPPHPRAPHSSLRVGPPGWLPVLSGQGLGRRRPPRTRPHRQVGNAAGTDLQRQREVCRCVGHGAGVECARLPLKAA